MLIQFTVENHRSIKNSAVISFAASKDKSFEEYLLHPDEKKVLLPVLAIYGANAAGKSFFGCDLNIVRKGDGLDFFPRKEALDELRANYLVLHDACKHQLVAELVFSHRFFKRSMIGYFFNKKA